MTYLHSFIEAFRFIRKFRLWLDERHTRRLAAEASERAHQLAMLDTIFSKMVEFSRAQNEGMLEVAKAQLAQSNVMAEWLKGFHISDPTPLPPQVVRDEDLWMKENMGAVLDELPPEFRLAFNLDKLQKEQNETFDREGSDF
jgi:hypothetical protein